VFQGKSKERNRKMLRSCLLEASSYDNEELWIQAAERLIA